jgi:prefoldin subunit 5
MVVDADSEDIQGKIKEHVKFLREVLRPNYDTLLLAEQATHNEIQEYEELSKQLNDVKQGTFHLEMDVDLGHRKASCKAIANESTRQEIFVHIGMGFHVQLAIEESLIFVQKRLTFLLHTVLPHRVAKSIKLRAHIQSSENILDELSNAIK